MIIRLFAFILIFCGYANRVYSQTIELKDADNRVWYITDTIKHINYYCTCEGNIFQLTERSCGLIYNKEELDSIIIQKQYSLWAQASSVDSFEPYATVVFALLFSNDFKIVDVRILKREAYDNTQEIDSVVIKSIRASEKIWSNNINLPANSFTVFIARARVVVPDVLYRKGRRLCK